MNKEELILEFYREKLAEIKREYNKTDSIQSRMYILALDDEDDVVIGSRSVPKVMYYEGAALSRAWERLQEYKKKFVESVAEDGYKVLALLHVEYEEDLLNGFEEVCLTLTRGRAQQKIFMRHFYISRSVGGVDEDGNYIPSVVTFKRIASSLGR